MSFNYWENKVPSNHFASAFVLISCFAVIKAIESLFLFNQSHFSNGDSPVFPRKRSEFKKASGSSGRGLKFYLGIIFDVDEATF